MSTIYGKIFDKSTLSESHKKIIKLIGPNLKVLELGSASGYMTQRLNESGCEVDIVEIDNEDAKKASKYAHKIYIGNLEDSSFLSSIGGEFDVILAADVLEHISYPEVVLKKLRKNLKKDGRLIISLPNIACWPIRKDLFLKGKFEYTDTGILDRTHLRFFTYQTIIKFLEQSDYKLDSRFDMEILYPFRNSIKKIPLFGKIIDYFLAGFFVKNYPNLAVCHMILVAKLR